MLKVIATFHVTYVSHILFVGTKSPTTAIKSQLSNKRLAIFAWSTFYAIIQIDCIFHHRFYSYQVVDQIFQNDIAVGSTQAEEIIGRFRWFGNKHNISPCTDQVQIEHGTKCFHFSIHLLYFGGSITCYFIGKQRWLLHSLQKVVGIIDSIIEIIPSWVQHRPSGTGIKTADIRTIGTDSVVLEWAHFHIGIRIQTAGKVTSV